MDKVLQIATLSPEKVQLKQERLDVHDILRQLEEAFTVRLEAQNGAIATDHRTGHHLMGDLVHITNILGNLLDNAAKYTQRGRRFRWALQPEPRDVANPDQGQRHRHRKHLKSSLTNSSVYLPVTGTT